MLKKGLAWDDKPKIITLLKKSLLDSNIDLTVLKSPEDFEEKISDPEWDFFVVDLWAEDLPQLGINSQVGLNLTKKILKAHTDPLVFMITQSHEYVSKKDLGIEHDSFFILHKSLYLKWVAGMIEDELKRKEQKNANK